MEACSKNSDQNGGKTELFLLENGNVRCWENMTHGRYDSYLQIFEEQSGDRDLSL